MAKLLEKVYRCVNIALGIHSDCDNRHIVREAQLAVDTHNATREFRSAKVVRC